MPVSRAPRKSAGAAAAGRPKHPAWAVLVAAGIAGVRLAAAGPQETAGPEAPPAQAPALPGPEGPRVVLQTLTSAETGPLDGLELVLEPAPGVPGPHVRVADRRVLTADILFLRPEPGETSASPGPPPPLRFVLRGGDAFWARANASAEAEEDEDLIRISSAALAPGSPAEPAGAEHGTLALDVGDVRLVLFRPALDDLAALRRLEARLLRQEPESDQLYLTTGSPVAGFLERLGPDRVVFSGNAVGKLELAYARVQALALAKFESDGDGGNAPAAPPGPLVSVHLHDGGRLEGQLGELSASRILLHHPELGRVPLRLEAVSQVSFRGGRCQYLSDLEPVKIEEHLGPLFRIKKPYQRDASVEGTPLRMAGTTYPKGVGVHAYSRLEYGLGGKFERFQATIGLDETAEPPTGALPGAAGAVVFRVYADEKRLLEVAMDHDDPPREVDLAVNGAQRLALEVDFGEGNFQLARDRANWCSARIIQSK